MDRFLGEAGRKAEVLTALENTQVQGMSGEVSDRLFFLSRDLQGREKAYHWLVSAQIESFGWQSYWSAEKRARERWEIVKALYPERWYQFFMDTVKDRKGRGKFAIGHGTIRRTVEYCLFMEQCDVAREIIERIEELALQLVSPLNLPVPGMEPHLMKRYTREPLDVLFTQFTWPLSFVRERACSAIAELIADPASWAHTLKHLLSWLKEQELESIEANGLLILLRAKSLNASVPYPIFPRSHNISCVPPCCRGCSLKSFIPAKRVRSTIRFTIAVNRQLRSLSVPCFTGIKRTIFLRNILIYGRGS